VLGFVWGTLIVGIVITTIANLNTTTTDTPIAKLFIVHLALTYPLLVWSSLGILAFLTLLSWLGCRERQAPRVRPLSEHDRTHMLRRLRLRYEQLLRQSLQGAVQLELGLAERPAAVQNAISLSLRLPDQPEQPLPPHTSIVQAYELAHHELLILGEPGAGKSTLLLELAHYLVEQAEQDASHLLPILVPLSSWAVSRRLLHEWLVEQITLLYDVPRSLGQQWIQAGLVLPLLDGLDEVEESARAACIAAINAYHGEHVRPLVVCSRTGDYEQTAVSERLALHAAVVVQPLSQEQIDVHLEGLGRPLAGLRASLRKNPALRELATTPLMLQVLMLTYHSISVRALSRNEAELHTQIWEDYIARMVKHKGDTKRYPLPVTIFWLSWLAREMRKHNQTTFYLEWLQPDWLPKRQRTFYHWNVGLDAGLVFGLYIGPISGPIFGLVGGLIERLVIGLFFGLPVGLFFGLRANIKPVGALTWSWKNLRLALVVGLVGGLVTGLLSRPGIGTKLVVVLIGALSTGLVIGLAFFGLLRKQLSERLIRTPNEGIQRSVKNGLVVGLAGGLIVGLVGHLDTGLVGRLVGGLFIGLYIGLVLGLGAAIQHYILRFWLAHSAVFPWRAVPFLEDATTRILLRRVGGGYSFAHRLLLDYFADLDAQTPLVQEAAQTKPTPVQTKASTSADESLK
jgi:DNA polymerase III delta prime subunit